MGVYCIYMKHTKTCNNKDDVSCDCPVTMNKKYRQLQNLPYSPAGTIWEQCADGESIWVSLKTDWYLSREDIKDFSSWFEEVDGRWKPKKGEMMWLIKNTGGIGRLEYEDDGLDKKLLKYGNCFRTEEEALKAKEKIAEVLKQIHEYPRNNPKGDRGWVEERTIRF